MDEQHPSRERPQTATRRPAQNTQPAREFLPDRALDRALGYRGNKPKPPQKEKGR